MASLTDDRGYNQMFAPSKAMQIRSERRCDMIISEMTIIPETSILEIGCGTGEIASFIAQKTKAQVLGTDICVPFIEEAKEKHKFPNLSFDVLNFNSPETLQGKKFDYVINVQGDEPFIHPDQISSLAGICNGTVEIATQMIKCLDHDVLFDKISPLKAEP